MHSTKLIFDLVYFYFYYTSMSGLEFYLQYLRLISLTYMVSWESYHSVPCFDNPFAPNFYGRRRLFWRPVVPNSRVLGPLRSLDVIRLTAKHFPSDRSSSVLSFSSCNLIPLTSSFVLDTFLMFRADR